MMEENKKGLKHDGGKEPVGMLFEYFPRALLSIASVAGFGARKYTRGGWISVPDGFNRYQDALGRHLLKKHIDGYDDESKLTHLAHAAWNALAILELELRGLEEFERSLGDVQMEMKITKDRIDLHENLRKYEQEQIAKASLDDQIESVAGFGIPLAAREEPYSAEEIAAVGKQILDTLNDITDSCIKKALRTTEAPTGAEVRPVRRHPALGAGYIKDVAADGPYEHVARQLYSD